MPKSLACTDCQKLLAINPHTLDQPALQQHLTNCATCSRLAIQYREIDKLLNQVPDLQPLPDLALRLQHIPQAQHISELDERFVLWKNTLEEPVSRSLMQGKKTMSKQPITPDPEPSDALKYGQFQQPVNQPSRARRSSWRVFATAAAVIVVLVNIFAWGLLPRFTQQSTIGGQRKATPTATHSSASPTPVPTMTQQYTFTDQDSGKTVTYTVTSRFQIILDPHKYPQANIQVACTPPNTLGSVSNLPSVTPPLYAVRYMGVQPGTCTIRNGTFLLTVVIVQLPD